MNVPCQRFGKWKPLGVRNHVPSDSTLLKLSSFLGKHLLMDYVRRVAATDLLIAPLVEEWDALTQAAQRAVTLTDLCYLSRITPASFISAATRGSFQAGHACVLMALSTMNLPEDVEVAVREWFVC